MKEAQEVAYYYVNKSFENAVFAKQHYPMSEFDDKEHFFVLASQSLLKFRGKIMSEIRFPLQMAAL